MMNKSNREVLKDFQTTDFYQTRISDISKKILFELDKFVLVAMGFTFGNGLKNYGWPRGRI